jgi:hypothetical protein
MKVDPSLSGNIMILSRITLRDLAALTFRSFYILFALLSSRCLSSSTRKKSLRNVRHNDPVYHESLLKAKFGLIPHIHLYESRAIETGKRQVFDIEPAELAGNDRRGRLSFVR